MALRIAPKHTGALKGLAFLYLKVGDVDQARAHLETALKVDPDDASLTQALEMVHQGVAPESGADAGALVPAEAIATGAEVAPLEDPRVFAGLEGAQPRLLLLHPAAPALGGALKD